MENLGSHAAEGSLGADLIKLLQSIPYEYMIKKQGYSAFYDTNLQEILDFWDIRNLFFCGVYTEVALFQSTLDAFHRGYRLWLIEDGITGQGMKTPWKTWRRSAGRRLYLLRKLFAFFRIRIRSLGICRKKYLLN